MEPIFIEGKRGRYKSISVELGSEEFFYEREVLEGLLDTANCEKHKKL